MPRQHDEGRRVKLRHACRAVERRRQDGVCVALEADVRESVAREDEIALLRVAREVRAYHDSLGRPHEHVLPRRRLADECGSEPSVERDFVDRRGGADLRRGTDGNDRW